MEKPSLTRPEAFLTSETTIVSSSVILPSTIPPPPPPSYSFSKLFEKELFDINTCGIIFLVLFVLFTIHKYYQKHSFGL